MSNKPKRADFMKQKDKDAMFGLPRTHQNCKEKTGVCRPGKTAFERYKASRGHES